MITKSKFRDLTAVFFIGLFVLTWEPVFLWLLVCGLVLLHPEKVLRAEEGRGSGHKALQAQIRQDAKRFHCPLPHRPSRRALLQQVYQRYQAARERYPHLQSEYRDLIHGMWVSLSSNFSPEHWDQVLTAVLAEWPGKATSGALSLQEKLAKVRELSEQWDSAESEALGGTNV
jgi:hypothetical protein